MQETAKTADLFPSHSPSVIISVIVLIVASALIVVWSSRKSKTVSTYYVAGHAIGAWQNAFALAGDFVGAGGFLALTGLVAIFGADGLVYAIGVICSWPLMLFLFAEPLRKLGKYTLADLLSARLGGKRIRPLVACVQLIIVLMSLTAQLVAATAILKMLLGLSGLASLSLIAVVLLGFVMVGGMLATTWLEIFKAMLMLTLSIVIALLVLSHFGFNPLELAGASVNARGFAVLAPGRLYTSQWELVSVLIGMALGGCSMPHVLMRMNTVTDVRTARRSVFLSTGIIVVFHLVLLVLGFGAMVLVGSNVIRAVDASGNMALPLLARAVGGDLLLGIVSAVALSTILAVVAGLSIAGAAAISHDLWSNSIRRASGSEREKLLAGRVASMILILFSTGSAFFFQQQNIGFVSAAANAIAAASVFPTLFLAIFWKRLTPPGAIAGIATGATMSVLAIYFGPLVQMGVLKHPHAIFPLQNPAIITVPIALAVTYLVSLATQSRFGSSGQAPA